MGEPSKLSVEVDGTEVNKVIKYKDVKNPFYRRPDISTKTKQLKKLAVDKRGLLRPGDLIFFNIPRKKLEEYEPEDIPSYVIHVGIVISVHDNDYIEYVHATARGVVTAWLRKDHDVMFFRYPMDRRQNNAVVARAVQLAKQMVGYPYSSKQRIRMTKFIELLALTRAGASLSLEELQANTVVGQDEVDGHELEVGNSNTSYVKFIPPAGLKTAVRLSRESAALPLTIMRMYKLAMRPEELILGSNTTRRKCDLGVKSSDVEFVEWRGVCCDQTVITVYQVAELQVRAK